MTASEVLYLAGLACGAAGLLLIAVAGGLLAWALLAKLSADAVALAIGLMGGALAVLPMAGLLAAAERRGRHPMTLDAWPDDAPDALTCGGDDWMDEPPLGWEYQTEHRREYDGGLLYEERFTVLVPKQRSVVIVQKPKQLPGGER
jgi:hypothetical protein